MHPGSERYQVYSINPNADNRSPATLPIGCPCTIPCKGLFQGHFALGLLLSPPEWAAPDPYLSALPLCPSARPGVPERNHKTDEVISTVRMLSDLVGGAWSRGGGQTLLALHR